MKIQVSITIGCFLYTASLFAQDCVQPEITASTGAGTYCENDEVTLTITGTLNDATAWQWYAASCGGEDTVQTGTEASLTVTVDETISYFVKGVGGCVDPESKVCTEIAVVLDDEPPTVEACPENIAMETDPGVCGAVVEFVAPTGTDNCSETVTVEQTVGPESGSVFPVGETIVTYTLTDDRDNAAECSFTVTVNDTEPPAIICAADLTEDNNPGECGAVVTYEKPAATDNCEGTTVELTAGLGSGSFFPVGTTTETYAATDAAGNTSSCSFTITVNDVEPPIITLSKDKTSHWPPNHKYFSVNIESYIAEVWDNCPGPTTEDIIIYEVSSDEPGNGKGDGNTSDDILISDDCRSVQLRSERQGGGNGRVYSINLAVVDAHGNIGRESIRVEIPHDKGKKSVVIDDGPQYVVHGCDIEVEEEAQEQVADNSEETNDDQENQEEQESGTTLRTFPNPFDNSFEITYLSENDDEIEIDLYNLTGIRVKTLYKGSVKANKEYAWNVDTDYLKDMLYLVVIRGEKTYALKKIVRK